MTLVPVAVDYIETHRADSSDAEIARALREQGFSDETLSAAFRAAGERPDGSVLPVKVPAARRALVLVLVAASVLLFVGSALLFFRNFRQASRAAETEAPR